MANATVAGRTEVLNVVSTTLLLDLTGKPLPHSQEKRELTQNAIDAGATVVEWCCPLEIERGFAGRKLACIDNGRGMSPTEMRKYLGGVGASGQADCGVGGHFGSGGKLCAATRNPYGVLYASWQQGEPGHVVRLWKDPATRDYGLAAWDLGNGVFDVVRPAAGFIEMPAIIREAGQGTMVVLLGASDEEDTTLDPTIEPGTAGKEPENLGWVERALRERYFSFRGPVTIRTRRLRPGASRHVGTTDPVMSMSAHLDRHAARRGTLPLDGEDVTIHWWIMDADKSKRVGNGHFGVVFQDEVYERHTGTKGHVLLQNFGITSGTRRVMLYAEPTGMLKARMSASFERRALHLEGAEELPYDRWSLAFQAAMPEPIQQLLAEESGEIDERGDNDRSRIDDRLRKRSELFAPTCYRPARSGSAHVTEARRGANLVTVLGGRSASFGRRVPRLPGGGLIGPRANGPLPGSGSGNATATTQQQYQGRFVRVGTAVVPEQDPGQIAHEWKRDASFSQPGTAASYLTDRGRPTVHLNMDGTYYRQMLQACVLKYAGTGRLDDIARRDLEAILEEVVQGWWVQRAISTVMSVNLLREDRERWSDEAIQRQLSDESLNAAFADRVQILDEVNKRVNGTKGETRTRIDRVLRALAQRTRERRR